MKRDDLEQTCGTMLLRMFDQKAATAFRCLSLSLVVALVACKPEHSKTVPGDNLAQFAATPIVFPGFAVSITLSDKAKSELPARKETVLVAGYLFGFPGKKTPREYVSDMGEVGLGQVTAEVAPGQNASFDQVEINPQTVRLIDNHGPQLLINVASGRRSSENNLLNCGIYEGPLKMVEHTSISIRCKLIGE